MKRKYVLWPVHMRYMPKRRVGFGKGKIDELRYTRGNTQYLAWSFRLGKVLISIGTKG